MLAGTRIGLGTLRLDGDAAIRAALDAGITFFDTARAYGDGERVLGAALAAHPDAFVVTKGGMARPDGEWRPDGRAASLRRDCEASLAALGRPIDLYLVHAPDPTVKWATTMRALARLADEKLVRAIGVCNATRAQLDEALALAPIAAVQVALSLCDDGALRSGVVARARERGIPLIAHSPLGGPRRAKSLVATPLLVEIARRHEVAPAAVALAALLAAHPHLIAIPGARTAEQARQVAAAARLILDESERAELAGEFAAVRERPAATSATRGELVMLVGLPGAGKSLAAREFAGRGWERLNRDERGGTLAQLAAVLDERLAAGAERLVLDNTYVTRAQRAEVLAIAARHGVRVRGVFLDAPLAELQVNVVLRMLEAHGRLLAGDELRRGRDNTALAPTALWRLQRALEPPAADEGFASLETRPFVRAPRPGEPARFVTLDLVEKTPPDELRDAFVIGWAPSGAPALEGRCRAVALCPHGGGPPVCWCRPPLPGLLVALAFEHRLALARSELRGSSRAHRELARAVGARFVPC